MLCIQRNMKVMNENIYILITIMKTLHRFVNDKNLNLKFSQVKKEKRYLGCFFFQVWPNPIL